MGNQNQNKNPKLVLNGLGSKHLTDLNNSYFTQFHPNPQEKLCFSWQLEILVYNKTSRFPASLDFLISEIQCNYFLFYRIWKGEKKCLLLQELSELPKRDLERGLCKPGTIQPKERCCWTFLHMKLQHSTYD